MLKHVLSAVRGAFSGFEQWCGWAVGGGIWAALDLWTGRRLQLQLSCSAAAATTACPPLVPKTQYCFRPHQTHPRI